MAGGALVGGAGVGLGALAVAALRRIGRLEREIEALKARPAAKAGELPPDVWSIVALLKLTAKDNLDALTRVSPEAALAVAKEMFPQLFDRTVG